ncbi:MAG: hypothetical protein HY666_06715 [Chloroflexi bacterium]|nr:hypothetical protein [Chloroflexota bacterium]
MRLAFYVALVLVILLLVALIPFYLVPWFRTFYRKEISEKHPQFQKWVLAITPGFVKALLLEVPDLPSLTGNKRGIYLRGLIVTVAMYFVIGFSTWLVLGGRQPVLGFAILPFALTAWFYFQIAVPLVSIQGLGWGIVDKERTRRTEGSDRRD